MVKKEELMDRQTKWIEATEAFRKKEDEMKLKDAMYVCVYVCRTRWHQHRVAVIIMFIVVDQQH